MRGRTREKMCGEPAWPEGVLGQDSSNVYLEANSMDSLARVGGRWTAADFVNSGR